MKRILMICFAVLFLCQATAFAHTMTDEEMCIGGISLGCAMSYVESIYGMPQNKQWIEEREARRIIKYVIYKYSPTFQVIGRAKKNDDAEQDMFVDDVSISDNSLSTSSGITVGMPYSTVVETFGEGRKWSVPDGKTAYSYRGHGHGTIDFRVNSDGIITDILLYLQH